MHHEDTVDFFKEGNKKESMDALVFAGIKMRIKEIKRMKYCWSE